MALAPVRGGRATVQVMDPEMAQAMARATARRAKVQAATARTVRRVTPATHEILASPAMPDSHVMMTAQWPMKTSPRAPMMRVRTRTVTHWLIRP